MQDELACNPLRVVHLPTKFEVKNTISGFSLIVRDTYEELKKPERCRSLGMRPARHAHLPACARARYARAGGHRPRCQASCEVRV
jgi:hypothetical protein